MRVRWRDADSFDLPSGEKVTLRCPDWSRQDLGYGSMDPATRFSAGVAPR
ncbi:hypothetical protein [Paracoccus sediminilitoris]|nr:hypothetical protein [Paracoccus sediminilitoris]